MIKTAILIPIKWWQGVSVQTRSFIYIRVFYLIIGVFVARLLFVDKAEKAIVQQERDVYRDSLAIQHYKIQLLKNTLKNDKIQDAKDSLTLRGASLDSLIGYISALQVVTGNTPSH